MRIFKLNNIPVMLLFVICAGVVFMAAPAMNNNISDPNAIVYFNGDEGGQMDLIWYYYSGLKRDSFQWEFDYGLLMRYIADAAHAVSGSVNITAGLFVAILRWLNLIAWIASLLALWRLVNYHLRSGWMALLAAALLAVRPGFFCNIKPEPVILFFMIIGLDYSLRIAEKPSNKNLFIACACAAISFVIKFFGIFLLAAIVTAMYLSKGYRQIKIARILPALLSLAIITVPILVILSYARSSTGLTWYQQCGLWPSLFANKAGLAVVLSGAACLAVSIAYLFSDKRSNPLLKKTVDFFDKVNSCALIAFSVFFIFAAIFGIRWLINPRGFINTYAFFGSGISSGHAANMSWLYLFLKQAFHITRMFDPLIMLPMLFVIIGAIRLRYNKRNTGIKQYSKTMVIFVFLLPWFALMYTILRITAHQMLPFIAAGLVLAVQSFDILPGVTCGGRKICRNVIIAALCGVFVLDIGINLCYIANLWKYEYNQKVDIAFDFAKWMRKNIPVDAKIVSDHYTRVYVPGEYKNIIPLRDLKANRADALRKLVMAHKPEFLYYNLNAHGERPMPLIGDILPGINARLLAAFESKGRVYERIPNSSIVVYKLSY